MNNITAQIAPRTWLGFAMMRGGRMTKVNGNAASYSPELGAAVVDCGPKADVGRSALALARRLLPLSATPLALFAASSPVMAQDTCTELSPGEFLCEDNGAGAETTQTITSSEGQTTVTIEDGFTVDTSGGFGDGINVTADGGLIITQIGQNGSIIGASSGLTAISGAGALSVTAADVTGTSSNGIFATNRGTGTDLTIDSSAGSVSGGRNGIVAFNFGAGALAITAADVTGTSFYGIFARNFGTDLTIDNSAGSVSGGRNGIDARNYGTDLTIDSSAGNVSGGTNGIDARNFGTGALSITAADVTGTSFYGIFARNFGTDLTIDSSAGSVSGGRGGITATNFGTGALSISAAVTTADVTGTSSDGIRAFNRGTDLTIDSSAGSVSGGRYGIHAVNSGSGALLIATADVTGTSFYGIFARNSGTDLAIDSSAGSVSGRSGIHALNRGTGALSITTADVTGTKYNGIYARNYGSGTDLTINSSAGSVSGSYNGIFALNSDKGALSITAADVIGTSYTGIIAFNGANGTDLTIDSSGGSVSGSYNGIAVANMGSGALLITAADVTGTSSNGILARNYGTDLTIESSAGSVSGGQDGIFARNNGTGALSITTADVTGTSVNGIDVRNYGTDLMIDSSEGSVSGAYAGIIAFNPGAGVLSITTADVTGTTNDGIRASSFDAGTGIKIDSSAGSVRGDRWGIVAQNSGTGALLITTADVTGTYADGIGVLNLGTDLTIDSSAGSVSGTSGIYARNYGTGAMSITAADITGTRRDGIRAVARGGDIAVSGNGNIMGSLSGISASTDGAGTITLDLSGITFGDVNGVQLSTGGGTADIINRGTLSGGTFAFAASSPATGPITLSNSGQLFGAMQFADSNDVLINSGSFFAAGNSNFGGGNDVFVNTGMLMVSGLVSFAGLEQTTNGGLINLVDGSPDDALSLSGNFVGTGGTLMLDVNLAGTSDRLTIAGAATGSTTLIVNDVTTSLTLGQKTVLVDAGLGTSASAFALAGTDLQGSPFVALLLAFDAANNDFLLSNEVQSAVFEVTKLGEAAQALWYRSSDAWAQHRAGTRFEEGGSAPLWLQLYGKVANRDDTAQFATASAPQTAVLDYQQDFLGFQLGYDWSNASNEGLSFGLTAGYLSSNLKFDARGNGARFDVFNFGASTSYRSNGLYADALLKYDFISGDLRDPVVGGMSGTLDGKAYGARGQIGYRTSGSSFFLEPQVSLEYQRTDLDDITLGASGFAFDKIDGLRGTAGIRLGGQTKMEGGTQLGYYLGASAVHEFQGEGRSRFLLRTDSFDLTNDAIDTYGHIEAGLNIIGTAAVSGFIQIEGDVSSVYNGYGGSAGIRFRF